MGTRGQTRAVRANWLACASLVSLLLGIIAWLALDDSAPLLPCIIGAILVGLAALAMGFRATWPGQSLDIPPFVLAISLLVIGAYVGLLFFFRGWDLF